MARKPFPRSQELHEGHADQVLQRYESLTDSQVVLPVPIEDIIERAFELEILYDEIAENPGTTILGALSPSTKTIVLNTRHLELFGNVLGPERFTLAHELGHWIYDADDPNQGSLDFGQRNDLFCYHRSGTQSLPSSDAIRETNANKFAACLLLPRHLVQKVDIDEVMRSFARTAGEWGVSQQTLRIRLTTLNMLDELDLAQLDFG